MGIFRLIFVCCGFSILFGCEGTQNTGSPLDDSKISGTGVYQISVNRDSNSPKMNVYYHVPSKAHTQSPILIVFHGNGRDAENSRNLLIKESENRELIIVCPEFSSKLFPGSNEYQLGGIFKDGENAKLSELRPSADWTFSIIDRMFLDFKESIKSEVLYYDMFGHSAGAQFVHRFITFCPNSMVRKAVSAASGWYTLPDVNVDFPYGLGQTGLTNADLEDVFAKSVLISVGSKDIDPNSSALRHDEFADIQGNNRLDRAKYYFADCQKKAAENQFALIWKLKENTGVEHDFLGNATAALQWLYP